MVTPPAANESHSGVRRSASSDSPSPAVRRVRETIARPSAALGHVRLLEVHLRHPGAGEPGEALSQPLLDVRIAHQAYPGDRGDRLAGDVVLCRAETAGEDRRVGPPECLADRGGDPLLVVTHHGVPQAVPTDVGEPLADPGGVAVDDLTEQQLGADPDDLAAHALLPLCSLVRP